MARARSNKIDFEKLAIGVLGNAAGGIGTRILTKRILPATMNPMIKNLLPAGVGIVLPMFIKHPLVDAIGNGMVAVSAADIVSGMGAPAPAPAVTGLANEYGIGNAAEEMAMYEETASLGNPNDAFNSLGQISYPSPWGSNPVLATEQSLAGVDDDFNSLAGGVDAGLSSEYDIAGM